MRILYVINGFDRRRMGRFHVKASADCALKGEWRRAAGYELTAMHLAPLHPRVWTNLVLLLASVVRPCYRALRRPWDALRQARYEA